MRKSKINKEKWDKDILYIYRVWYNFEQDKTFYNASCGKLEVLWSRVNGIKTPSQIVEASGNELLQRGYPFKNHRWKIFHGVIERNFIPIAIRPFLQKLCIYGLYLETLCMWPVWKCFCSIGISNAFFERIFPRYFFEPLEEKRSIFLDLIIKMSTVLHKCLINCFPNMADSGLDSTEAAKYSLEEDEVEAVNRPKPEDIAKSA